MRLLLREPRVVDRSGWPSGPWDGEPDDYCWTTEAGFPAHVLRLPTGALVGLVRAPHPPATGIEWSRYVHGLHVILKRHNLQSGMSSKTDVENVSDFAMSFEHHDCPAPTKAWNHGPYVTLEEAKQKCEQFASILKLPAEDITALCDF